MARDVRGLGPIRPHAKVANPLRFITVGAKPLRSYAASLVATNRRPSPSAHTHSAPWPMRSATATTR